MLVIVTVMTPILAVSEVAGVGFVEECIWPIWHVRVIVADCGMTVIALLFARVACAAIARIKEIVLSITSVLLMIDEFGLACSTMMMHIRCPMFNEIHWVT